MINVLWGEPKETYAPRPITTVWSIMDETIARYGISRALLISQRRQRALVLARHEAMYRCVHETAASYPEIARAFGDRDHTTIIHAERAHAKRLAAAQSATTKNAAPNGGPDGSHSNN